MQTVILCGGKATRLYSLTKKISKSMVRIEGRPFLEYQIELLRKNGIFDIILCIGNKGGQIKKYFRDGKELGVKIKYSKDGKKLLGTGGALKKAESLLREVFLVMYGDSYLPFSFRSAIKFFEKSDKLGLMTVLKNQNKYEKSNIALKGEMVVYYDKEKKAKEIKYIDYGLSAFKKIALNFFLENQTYDLSQLHKFLIEEKQLLAFEVKQRYYQIGSIDGLREFERHIAKNK